MACSSCWGILISKRAPRPGLVSIESSPPMARTRSWMSTLQIRMRKPATEHKAATIIINRENPISFLRTKPNQNIVCTAMPGHIHQRFLDDAGDLATDMWGKGHIAKITDKLGGNACIGSVALDHAGKKIDQMPGIEIQRFELLNQCSDIGSFV